MTDEERLDAVRESDRRQVPLGARDRGSISGAGLDGQICVEAVVVEEADVQKTLHPKAS